MTPDELLADLRGRRVHLDDLAAGQGTPLILPAALLAEVPVELARRVARAVAARDDVSLHADVSNAPEEDRPARLAFVAALAGLARHLDDPQPWHDLVDEARYDLLARPHAWRDLSNFALTLAETLDVTEETPHGSLLRLTARAALDAPSQELLAGTGRILLRSRRKARAHRWKVWLGTRSAPEALGEAVDRLETGALPLAASEGVPDALARVRIGEALGGEVSLAVVPAGLVLEWDGDGPPPDRVLTAGTPLEALQGASLAARAWLLAAPPPSGPLDLLLGRGEATAALRWDA